MPFKESGLPAGEMNSLPRVVTYLGCPLPVEETTRLNKTTASRSVKLFLLFLLISRFPKQIAKGEYHQAAAGGSRFATKAVARATVGRTHPLPRLCENSASRLCRSMCGGGSAPPDATFLIGA